ncbi:MAG TPA: ADP-glyceromanno-heptose 6-epimerase [Capsulimonadaceae bacterium]|nr:ADP-glyceromanno-heptose 6-epimerase [Capsulimonadaceae bacterium]
MIVVTGAAGFIGSVLVKALNDRGYKDVVVADTLGDDGKFKNLRAKQFKQIIPPDVIEWWLKRENLTADAILHIGAITDTSDPRADLIHDRNTRFTRTLAKFAMERGIRFIYASSASVYGDGSLGFSDDDALTPKLQPLNPYAFSKWLTDNEAIREGWNEKIAGLRFFNVFGPNEYHKGRMASVVWHSYNQVLETGKIKLFQSHKEGIADGEQARDFIWVGDVVNVILWFLDHPHVNGIYNLGTGKARTYNDLAAALFAAMDRPLNIEYIPTPENIRRSYQYFTQADLAKLRAAGCDFAFTPLEDSVRGYVRGYLQKDNPYL